jgi:hypothetical protein
MFNLHRNSTRSRVAKTPQISSYFAHLLTASALLSVVAAAASAQGFGGHKTVIDYRSAPPVYVPGPLIAVNVKSQKPISTRVTDALRESIETELLANDRRLALAKADADTTIACTIIDVSASSRVEGRVRSDYQKTGEDTVYNSSTGMNETVDRYGYVDVPYRALVREGRMLVDYEVLDPKTGIVLDSNRFSPIHTQVLQEVYPGQSAPLVDDLDAIQLSLVKDAAQSILLRISPARNAAIAALPGGKLKDQSRLLELRLWNDALSALGSVPPLKNERDDAYRLYAIGLAHEGLAYKSLDIAITKNHLEQALENYRRATQLKPGERYFWEPKNRVEQADWRYAYLFGQLKAYDEAKGKPDGAATRSDRGPGVRLTRPAQTPDPTLLTNETVQDWLKTKVPEEYILASIKNASGTKFDRSAAELLRLRQLGASNRTIKAIEDSDRHGFARYQAKRSGIHYAASAFLWVLPVLLGR